MERPLDLFIKQLAVAQRFERKPALRESMAEILKVVSNIKPAIKSRAASIYSAVNLNDVTMILNAVQEIKNIDKVLSDLIYKSNLKWIKDIHILVALTTYDFQKHSKIFYDIKADFPRFSWVVVPKKELAETLQYILESGDPMKMIVLTRNLQQLNKNFDMAEFLKPLHRKIGDIIGGSNIYPDGTWQLSCYQSKLIWSQYRMEKGFDASNGNWIRCDTIDGPFATDTSLMLEFLQTRWKLGHYYRDHFWHLFKGRPKQNTHLVYNEFMYLMHNANKLILVHPESVFRTDNTHTWLKVSRYQWKMFISKYKLGEIIISDSMTGHTIHHEFTYSEANSLCKYHDDMLQPRPCMMDLHNMLVNSFKLFDKYGFGYCNEDGSALGQIKLGTTLPWDLDHDFAFKSSDFIKLLQHEEEFNKLGITFQNKLDHPCVKGVSYSRSWRCGFIAFRDINWRLEAWGQYVMVSDFYRPHMIPDKFRNVLKWYSRSTANVTLVKMGDHWSVTPPNPGGYGRSKYGIDFLRHIKHWSKLNLESGLSNYIMHGPRFLACPDEGHHLCMDQYLADGNIQFQRVWA